ncbi:MAG: VOC family protein [Planctomycetota bacterium]
MTLATPHPHGTFCWPELATTDAAAATKFYSALFGLTIFDASPSPEMRYWILQQNGKDAAAVYQMAEEQKAMMPSAWTIYVAVPNAREAAVKARELGATVMMEGIDVMDLGSLSVIQDPTGAVFAVWETKTHKGATAMGTVGTFCWAELNTNDTARAKDFYTKMFPWKAKESTNPEMPYTEWVLNGQEIGGLMKIDPAWGEVPPHWNLYFMTDNVDATVAKATTLGATTCVPPMDIPNVGRFAVLMDPTGAAFSVFQMAAGHK